MDGATHIDANENMMTSKYLRSSLAVLIASLVLACSAKDVPTARRVVLSDDTSFSIGLPSSSEVIVYRFRGYDAATSMEVEAVRLTVELRQDQIVDFCIDVLDETSCSSAVADWTDVIAVGIYPDCQPNGRAFRLQIIREEDETELLADESEISDNATTSFYYIEGAILGSERDYEQRLQSLSDCGV